MAMILLAVEDAGRDAAIRDLLTAEGWWVTTVGSQEEALRAAADHAPELLIVDSGLAQLGSLLHTVRRSEGGPGMLVLADGAGGGDALGGDGTLGREQDPAELLEIVRRALETPRAAGEAPIAAVAPSEDQQLTTSDLFGDILEGLGGEALGSAIEERAETEPEPESEPELEVPPPDAESEPAKESESESELGPDPEPVPEFELEPEADPEAEVVAGDTEPEPDAKTVQDELRQRSAARVVESLKSDGETVPLSDLLDLDPEPTTDIEAEVAHLLEAADLNLEATGEIERQSIEAVLAIDSENQPPAPEVVGEVERRQAEEPARGVDEHEGLELVGRYRLLELLEFGDLTERWLAVRADGDARRVVLERTRPELRNQADVRQAFVDGYSEAAGWEHPNVLKVVDLGRDGDVDFVVTDYSPGHSLHEVLGRIHRMEARMPLGIGLLVAERLAAALEAVGASETSRGHRWLVPSSVWLSSDGRVLLREFSYGRLRVAKDPLARDWKEHRFIAPEIWSGAGDERSDLYSLGALLYEMVSGRPVHEGDDLEALVAAIKNHDAASAQVVDPTIPSEVDAWIMRLIRRSPEERPQAVSEISSKIDLALQSLPARPANAELDAYLRQLFAATVPEQQPADSLPVELPNDEQTLDLEAEGVDPSDLKPGKKLWRAWRWLLVVVIALVVALLAWRAESAAPVGSRQPVAPGLDSRADPIELPPARDTRAPALH